MKTQTQFSCKPIICVGARNKRVRGEVAGTVCKPDPVLLAAGRRDRKNTRRQLSLCLLLEQECSRQTSDKIHTSADTHLVRGLRLSLCSDTKGDERRSTSQRLACACTWESVQWGDGGGGKGGGRVGVYPLVLALCGISFLSRGQLRSSPADEDRKEIMFGGQGTCASHLQHVFCLGTNTGSSVIYPISTHIQTSRLTPPHHVLSPLLISGVVKLSHTQD